MKIYAIHFPPEDSFQTAKYGSVKHFPMGENTHFFTAKLEAIEAYQHSENENAYVGSIVLDDAADVAALLNVFSGHDEDGHYDNNWAFEWKTIVPRGQMQSQKGQ